MFRTLVAFEEYISQPIHDILEKAPGVWCYPGQRIVDIQGSRCLYRTSNRSTNRNQRVEVIKKSDQDISGGESCEPGLEPGGPPHGVPHEF